MINLNVVENPVSELDVRDFFDSVFEREIGFAEVFAVFLFLDLEMADVGFLLRLYKLVVVVGVGHPVHRALVLLWDLV